MLLSANSENSQISGKPNWSNLGNENDFTNSFWSFGATKMRSQKRLAVLFSGGKDSTFAIEKLRDAGYDIACLVTVISENPYSYMLHTPNIKTAELCAKALDIPIFFGSTKGEKEQELEDIRISIIEARKKYDFDYLGSGALCSAYQKLRLEKVAEEVGLSTVAPLWGVDQKSHLRSLLEHGYNFVLTSVSAGGLDSSWLGRRMDREAVTEISNLSEKYHFNPAFEGGEAETLVLDCPLYKSKRIEIVDSEKKWDGSAGILLIRKAQLLAKNSTDLPDLTVSVLHA